MAIAPYFPEQELKRLGFSGPAIAAFRTLLQVAELVNGQETLDSGLTDTALLAILTEARVDDLEDFQADGPYVKQDVGASWAAPAATVSRAALANYTAPTISNPPTQAEVQAIADALQATVRAVAGLITDGRANGVLKE